MSILVSNSVVSCLLRSQTLVTFPFLHHHVAGAFKRTDDNRWAHVLCALYIPEIEFGDVTTMEPIIVSGVPASSFNRICCICEENKSTKKDAGVCLTCFKPNCKVSFHVTCAQSRGMLDEEQGKHLPCTPTSLLVHSSCGGCEGKN